MNSYNDPVPDFILNRSQDEQVRLPFWWSDSNDPIPDFIKQNQTDLVPGSYERPKFNRKDFEVQTQLWIDYDDSFSSNPDEVKSYVDSLSDEDYEIWEKRKDEWYSLDARKALMDNKDLINTKESWNLKYIINTPKLDNWALQFIQNTNEWYEQLHPWLTSAEEWLDQANATLEENLGKENMMNRWIDKNDPYNANNKNEFLANNSISNYENFVNMVQIPKVLAQWFNTVAWKAINAIDQIANMVWSVPAEVVDLYQKIQGKEPIFNIQYGENRSNPIGSYINIIEDALWAWFVAAYPVATYFFSLLGAQNEDISKLEELVFQDKPGQAIDWLLSRQTAQDLIEIAWLNSKDQDSLRQALIDWLLLTIWSITSWWWKKLESSDIIKLQKEATKKADLYAKQYAKQQMQENYTMKDAAWTLPEGTEVLNKKGKTIARSTSEWWQFTPRWSLETIGQGVKWYAKGFAEYMRWFYKNRWKWMVERDPSTPVGELPDMKSVAAWSTPVEWEKIQEEITPERQKEIDEKWFYTDEKPIVKETTKVKPKESGTTIWEFIKKNINKISGKKWWLNKDMITKLQNSTELQNEYVSTIDPYLKENGAENPAWVIQEPLNSFIETVKDQLLNRKLNNQEFRRWQKQYKVEISEEEKLKNEMDDKKLKDLEKIFNKKYDDPEKFLEYLLKLPEEKVNTLNELIPDFSKNLWLIKDVLDLTKGISSSDLLWKFLKFKSTWWTRDRKFIRKWIYKKLSDTYKKAGLKQNMYEIETILNKLTDDKLIELEKLIEQGEDLPAYMKEDFINNLYNKLDKKPIEAVEWKKIWENVIELPKAEKEKRIHNELVKQWYRREEDLTPEYQTEEEFRKHKFPDWTTMDDWLKLLDIELKSKIFTDWRLAEADFLNKAIRYSERWFKISAFIWWHEIGHFLLWKLTTAELFDLVEWIRKINKDSWNEINRVWMWEYLGDTISNSLNYGDINWLTNMLKRSVTDNSLKNKIETNMNQFKEKLSKVDASKKINEEIQKLLWNIKKDKLYQKREPRYDDPAYQWGKTAWERMDFLRKVDPNLKDYSFDLDVDSPTFSEMRFNMKDWKSLSWDEWKDTLSHDQYVKLYSSEDLFNLEKEIKNQGKDTNWRDDLKKEIMEAEAYFGEEKYEKYKKELKDIDPDILGLVERDWQIYVKYLMESQRERWELPNRPGYLELKEVPAKDYFTEEELKKLPKDLQDKINNNAD